MGLRGDAVCDRTFGTCDTNKRLLAFRVVCSPDGVTTTTTTTIDGVGVACDDAAMRAMRAFFFSTMLCIYFSDTVCVCVCVDVDVDVCFSTMCSSMCPVAALYDARAV